MRRRFMTGLNDSEAVVSAPWLFLNAGQSNDEKGTLLANVDLTAPYQVPFPEVQYYDDAGVFRTMHYTDQNSFQSPLLVGTQAYANQFYLYPQLAAALGCTAANPLYVCSYSVGDTDLSSDWKSTATVGALYTAMINRITACIAALTSLYGVPPRIFCFLWDQGEKDGRDSAKATAYSLNMTNFRTNVRAAVGDVNLKFYFPLIKLAGINGSPNPIPFGPVVNDAKRALESDPLTKCQDTNYYKPATDGVHFDAPGQLAKNNGQIQDFINYGWLPGTPVVPPAGYTKFNGYNTFEYFPTAWESLITSAGAQFRLGISVWNPPFYSTRTLVSKFYSTTNQRSFHWILAEDLIIFNFYGTGAGGVAQGISWSGFTGILYDGNTHTLEIRYDGTQATALARLSLYVDGALYTTGKTHQTNSGAMTNIFAGSARVAIGALVQGSGAIGSTAFVGGGWLANFFVQNNAGVATINVPDISTGIDTSGNGYNGTIVNP